MRRALFLFLTLAGASVLALSQVFAQSGVMSGPPQVIKGAPPSSEGPSRGPPDAPRLRSQDERPGLRSQDERPGLRSQDERPGLRSQDEPPGRRQADRPDQRATWIAVAGGFDGKGQNVGVGYSGFKNSRVDAENEALRACDGYGRGVRCREPYSVSNGCLYIVPGSRQGGVTWGRGSTRDLALEQCRRGGYRCDSKRVVGGCVPDGR